MAFADKARISGPEEQQAQSSNESLEMSLSLVIYRRIELIFGVFGW